MNRICAALTSLSLLLIASCAEDLPPASEVRDQFHRGFAGEGQLGPVDRQDDPYVNARGAETLPPH